MAYKTNDCSIIKAISDGSAFFKWKLDANTHLPKSNAKLVCEDRNHTREANAQSLQTADKGLEPFDGCTSGDKTKKPASE